MEDLLIESTRQGEPAWACIKDGSVISYNQTRECSEYNAFVVDGKLAHCFHVGYPTITQPEQESGSGWYIPVIKIFGYIGY